MKNTDAKLANIEHVISRWLEPEGGLTSFRAMMEILRVMDDLPPDTRMEHGAEAAEFTRYQQDRPQNDGHATPAPKVVRSKSSFLG